MPGRSWTLLPTPGAVRHQGVFAPFSRLYGSRRRAGTDAFFMQKEEENMKKRALSLLMAFVMVLSLLPATARAADVQEITDADGLAAIANDPSGSYVLKNDIGSESKPVTEAIAGTFTGTFDGNGHKITLNISGTANTGLFSKIGQGGTVKNVITAGTVTGTGTGKYVGGIAGTCEGTIQNCGNTAVVTGKQRVGGIAGHLGSKSAATIENCYNAGAITGTSYAGGIAGYVQNGESSVKNTLSCGNVSAKTQLGALVGYCQGGLSNSWWKSGMTPDQATGWIAEGKASSNASYTDLQTAVNALNTNRGSNAKWTVKDGAPTLNLVQKGGASTDPTIEIKPSETTIYVETGYKFVNEATLTATVTNLPEGATIQWDCDNADAATLVTDPDNDKSVTVNAASIGGVATVTATVCINGKPVTTADSTVQASCKVTVIPHITTIEIQGTPAVGQTLQARAYLEGGETFYDEIKGLPKLNFTWKKQVGSDYEEVGTGDTLKVTDALLGYNLWLYTWYGSENKISNNPFGPIVSAAEGYLKEDASWLYDQMLQYTDKDVEFKADTTLFLPKTATPHGSTVTWKCDSNIINTETGKLTLPETGEKPVVKLTATLTNSGETTTRDYEIKVWSKKNLADYDADLTQKLTDDVNKALGESYKLTPTYGKDTNVLTMVTNDLHHDDIRVTMGTPVRTNATANMAETVTNIANDGTITYFYIDPNSDPMQNLQRFGTFSVPFTFARDGVSVTRNVSVTVYWDRGKVTKAMEDQIVPGLPKISGEVTEISPLPSTVNNKTWTGIEWSSNDNAITFKKPAATDPFGPWEVVVRGSSVAKDVTLTAKLTFRYTNDVTGSEEPITILKYFYVTVPASDDGKKYQDALNTVFDDDSLKDITGDGITSADGVYSVSGDIQFPITGDLNRYMLDKYGEGNGFDGKYTPVLITSSDPSVIKAPDVANAARVAVYRPAVGQGEETVTLTVKILDRPSGSGRDYANLPVLAEKRFTVTVQPLTKQEITNELALMAQAKAHYWDGIRGANDCAEDVTADLTPFVEVYKQDGALVWVRDVREMKNSGIVPVAMDGWQDLEAWRLFRSSNPAAVTHENLLVTQQFEGKAVTVTSALSSETLGRYGELYRKDRVKYAAYAACDGLYYQPVRAELVVRGRNTARMVKKMITVNSGMETRLVSEAVEEKVTVSFTLSGNGELWLGTRTLRDLDEGVTVFDVLRQLRKGGVLSFEHKGGYVQSITCGGKTLTELDEGKNSGWLYTVNGELPDVYMSAYGLKNGDSVRVYFTKDYTKEPGADRWKPVTPVTKTETVTNADGSVTKIETKSDGTVIETTTWRDGSTLTAETSPNGRVETIEKRADGTTVETVESASGEITASVSVPKSVGSTRVDIPVSKPTGSMVAVIVHPDGTEEIVRGSVVTETGVALRAEGDVRLKIIDNAKSFNDMADHWAKDAVEFASSRELFNGVGNDAFGPDRSMTRGMVGTVLARLAGADTAGGETWYAKGTVWAVENGISDGTAPEQPVTREQLAAMLYRYAGSPAVSGELGFDDADSISAWARDAVRWCVDNGILNGVGGNRMAPQDLAQRGQVAAMLMRFLQATV